MSPKTEAASLRRQGLAGISSRRFLPAWSTFMLAAIVAILASGGTVAAQFGAALMFTLAAFTVVEVPLITYLATPAKTLAVVQLLNDWISAHRQAIPAVVVGVIGVLLMATGMGNA